jgi:hypothetical protein
MEYGRKENVNEDLSRSFKKQQRYASGRCRKRRVQTRVTNER